MTFVNNVSTTKGLHKECQFALEAIKRTVEGKGQFYYARTTHTVCLLYYLISKQKHPTLPKTHLKSLAKELPHPIQRYLLLFTKLGNADTIVLQERDTFTDYIIHYGFFNFIYIYWVK